MIDNVKSIFSKQIVMMVLGASILAILLLSNVSNIYTVWELEDEGGFLFNASLLAQHDWKGTFSNATSYYGVGYSIFLAPLFLIVDTGIELIRGACVVNILFVICTYCLLVYLLNKLCSSLGVFYCAIISFIVCCYPYVISNTMKVVAEPLINLMVIIIAVFLFKFIETNKIRYGVALMVATAYIYFVHTRALIVVGVVGLIMLWQTVTRQIKLSQVIAMLVSLFLVFGLLSMYKSCVLDVLNTGTVALSQETQMNNVIDNQYILNRISWIFEDGNLLKYILCAIGKLFYLTAATAGVIWFGIIEILKVIKNADRKEVRMVCLYVILTFVLTYLACVFNGTDFIYKNFFYGRYYEYTIGLILSFGIVFLIKENKNKKFILGVMTCSTLMGILTQYLVYYDTSNVISIDTNRLVGISYILQYTNNYLYSIQAMILFVGLYGIIFYIVQEVRIKKIIIFAMLLGLFGKTSVTNVEFINSVNERLSADIPVTEYIENNIDTQDIYFVYEQAMYTTYYMRIQVYLKEYLVKVILPEEVERIEDDAFVVTFLNSDKSMELEQNNEYVKILETPRFELFEK